MAGLIHPNIVVLHEIGETTGGRPYLIMEYVEGANLRTVLAAGRMQPTRRWPSCAGFTTPARP